MKYKVLRSVAHNFGHSFVSLTNYGPDDFFMSYLTDAALRTGECELRIDLLSGAAGPSALLTPPIQESIAARVEWFPSLLASHDVPMERIREAVLRIELNLREPARQHVLRRFQVPFECTVDLTDDRGKVHTGRIRDSWPADPRPTPARPRLRPWWKFWRWQP